jgi:hypothetical protein
MIKILLALMVFIFLQSCSTNIDGSKTFGIKGIGAWWKYAPLEDRLARIRDKKTYQLCIMWDENYRVNNVNTKIRETISELLIERNENPMLCRNPELDKTKRLEDRVRAAEAKAREAERKAKQAERDAKRKAERRANDPMLYDY